MPLDTSINMEEYQNWVVRPTADANNASIDQIIDGLKEIAMAEGPILTLRAYQSYCHGSGLKRVGPSARVKLDRALKTAIERDDLRIETEHKDPDLKLTIMRLPDQPIVRPRTLGDRAFNEIPPSELAELILNIRAQNDLMGKEELYRAVLAQYGLIRITSLVQSTLDHVLETYF